MHINTKLHSFHFKVKYFYENYSKLYFKNLKNSDSSYSDKFSTEKNIIYIIIAQFLKSMNNQMIRHNILQDECNTT